MTTKQLFQEIKKLINKSASKTPPSNTRYGHKWIVKTKCVRPMFDTGTEAQQFACKLIRAGLSDTMVAAPRH